VQSWLDAHPQAIVCACPGLEKKNPVRPGSSTS
jgi:hypothetical protein